MKRFLIRTEVDDEEVQTEEAQENIPTQKRTSTTKKQRLAVVLLVDMQWAIILSGKKNSPGY